MENAKSAPSGISPPPVGRHTGFSQNTNFEVKPELPEPQGSSKLPPLEPGNSLLIDSSEKFSQDINLMPENPPKHSGHRRAHSEILTLPDDISFDSDLGVVGGLDGPSYSDDTEEDLFTMYLDMDKFNSSCVSSAVAEFLVAGTPTISTTLMTENLNERPTRIRHKHSQSMDGSTTIEQEMLIGREKSSGGPKKSMSAAKLSEMALVDPKRAKRILANRQSAARSKERKMRYIAELERKVQTLQTEVTSLSTQLNLLQRDTGSLNVENNELKLRLQTMEQQIHLQDALNDALKEEIQHVKVLMGQAIANGGPTMKFGAPSPLGQNVHPFYPHSNNSTSSADMQTMLTAHHFQQLQIHSQKQQQQFQQQQLHQFHHQQGDLKVIAADIENSFNNISAHSSND